MVRWNIGIVGHRIRQGRVVCGAGAGCKCAWAQVADRCTERGARPASENGRKPHEGRQHTASAFSSAWRGWVIIPRIAAVAPPAPGSPVDYFERVVACTSWRLGDSARRVEPESGPSRGAMPPLPAPPARRVRLESGLVTTIRDTVSCSWIFYSECRARLYHDLVTRKTFTAFHRGTVPCSRPLFVSTTSQCFLLFPEDPRDLRVNFNESNFAFVSLWSVVIYILYYISREKLLFETIPYILIVVGKCWVNKQD